MNFYDLVHCQTVDGYSCVCIAPSWSYLEADDVAMDYSEESDDDDALVKGAEVSE